MLPEPKIRSSEIILVLSYFKILFILQKFMLNHIGYISYNNLDQVLLSRSKEILNDFFKTESYTFSEDEGQLLFVASGGSEQNAVQRTQDHQSVMLLCHRESNSYAASMEIAAYLRAQQKKVSIIDVFAPDAYEEFLEMRKVNKAVNILAKQKAGLIGLVSDWLITSDVPTALIKEKLGIEFLRLSWDTLADYRDKEPSAEFMTYFSNWRHKNLEETAKVYHLLEEVIQEYQLSAISVECFSMVMRDKVTACLPLAVLNTKNVVAACEGDICAMLGKMLIRAVSDQIPWQANIADIQDNVILFAHCTAPLHLLQSFVVDTHFETHCGTAIRGKFEKQRVGVFRVNNTLDKYMLIEGDIINTPDFDFACRTQIQVKTNTKQAELLKYQSLGNHQLIFPVCYISLVQRLMKTLGIVRVE